jgi:cell division protein FtsL
MALLKKIKSATLIESLVATVLIVIVFIVASLIINNLLFNSFSRNTHPVEQRLTELEYKIKNKQLRLPYKEQFEDWDIELKQERKESYIWVKTTAVNRTNKKEVVKTSLYAG